MVVVWRPPSRSHCTKIQLQVLRTANGKMDFCFSSLSLGADVLYILRRADSKQCMQTGLLRKTYINKMLTSIYCHNKYIIWRCMLYCKFVWGEIKNYFAVKFFIF